MTERAFCADSSMSDPTVVFLKALWKQGFDES
jgi:hypothetical protein